MHEIVAFLCQLESLSKTLIQIFDLENVNNHNNNNNNNTHGSPNLGQLTRPNNNQQKQK